METPELLRTAPSHQSPPRSKAKGVGVLHAAGAAAPSSWRHPPQGYGAWKLT